jgi:dTDP-4-dehydrorhamnose reductase
MINNIFLTGGSGLLGTELQKYLECDAPTHKQVDITDSGIKGSKGIYDLIIHCAAYTDVVLAEKEPTKCLDINVFGTLNLLRAFPEVPFVYISSEYVKNPVNFYSKTKQLAEEIIELESMPYEGGRSYLIIRTLFKPNPFPWDKAFIDQYTQGDYANIIAPLIVKEIKKWNKINSKIVYVGTGRKTIYELAIRTKPGVKKVSVNDIKEVKLPKDYL